MTARLAVPWWFVAAASLALGGCGRSAIVGNGSLSGAAGTVSLAVRLAGELEIARMSLTVGPGDGLAFDAFSANLVKTGGSWGAYVTGVPAGKGRLFSVAAYDAGGKVVMSGSAKCDILPAETAHVEIYIGSTPPPPYENAVPVLDFLSASRTRVSPGQQVTLGVSAHDPDPGDVVSFLWAASCGTFDSTTRSDPTWTAPSQPGTCHLTVTASDGRGGSVVAPLDILVITGDQRVVAGTRLVTYWPDPPAATITVPAADTTTSTAPLILARDEKGGWITCSGGHLAADGTFVAGSYGLDGSYVIPDPPAGVHALCWPEPDGTLSCVDTSQDRVDLGYDLLGRSDQAPASVPTPVQIALSGLNDWNPITDRIQVTSSGANLRDELVPAFRGGVTAGEVVEDWLDSSVGVPLHLTAAGDTLFVHQLSTRSFYLGDGTLMPYVAATQATPAPPDPAALTGISLLNGQAGSFAATLVQLPLTAAADVDWDMPAFEHWLPAMGPAPRTAADPTPHHLVVDANAFALDYPAPLPAGSPELVIVDLPAGLGRLSETFNYGRFLPLLWHEGLGVRYAAQVSYLAPGATTPVVEVAAVERHDAMPGPATVAPAVGPVLTPLLNGTDALADLSAPATATPTFSWAAPASGTPTAYRLEIFRLAANGVASVRTPVLRYTTGGLQVTVPPGLLEAGATYYARITAQISDVPFDAAPARRSAVGAQAGTFTGTFTP